MIKKYTKLSFYSKALNKKSECYLRIWVYAKNFFLTLVFYKVDYFFHCELKYVWSPFPDQT